MAGLLRGYFLSDLHLFARRSSAESIAPKIFERASRAHTMVLGGDIFDFKWSVYPTLDESIANAIRWLERLIASSPGCCFYYLLGNHDAHPRFVAELDRLAFREPRFLWHPYVLRIYDCVFLHGDIVDCEPNHTVLEERRKVHEDKPSPALFSHWMYDVAVHARLHRAVLRFAIRPQAILEKLVRYLANESLDAEHGVTDVYFGHTHREVDNVLYQGMRFHNGGASIRGLAFRIIETRLPTRLAEFSSRDKP